MTATSNTLYTLLLFLALAALNFWTERRQRIPCGVRATAAGTIPGGRVVHALSASNR